MRGAHVTADFAEVMGQSVLILYAIYDKPKDYPESFVVRRWLVQRGQVKAGPLLGQADTLEDARRLLPAGLCNIGRFQVDDPAIKEVWV